VSNFFHNHSHGNKTPEIILHWVITLAVYSGVGTGPSCGLMNQASELLNST